MPAAPAPTIHRHRTAISRSRLSVGARTALEDGLLRDTSTLDYGCGRGQDVVHLREGGIRANGWDPYFTPDVPKQPHDVVLLTYVLNTIEDPVERAAVLLEAWSCAQRVLVVTTRLAWERAKLHGDPYSDGTVTRRQTFQHLFTTDELRKLAQTALGQPAVVARPGIVYVFREDHDRLTHLAQRYALHDASAVTDLSQALAFYEERGRLPARIDGITDQDAARYARALRQSADPERVAAGRKATTLRLLLFLAMERFHGPVPWAALPAPVQADVQACFGTFKHATWRASRLLRQLRDDVVLRRTMRASVGKMTPSALYIHRRALPAAPILLRIYEECAALAAGRPGSWEVVKLHHDRRMVSWLSYPDFDRDPHPPLRASHHVDLANLQAGRSSYAEVTNPPVLHRKEEFLSGDDPRHGLYARLTASEARAGLYLNPHLIGTRDGWQSELARCGRLLRGHRLVRVIPPSQVSTSAAGGPEEPSRETNSS